MKRRTLFLALSIVCLANSLPAQESPGLFDRVERAFREHEPAWKVEQTRRGDTSDPLTLDMTFRSGKTQASVGVRLWRRGQDAREVFAAESLAFDNVHGRRMVKSGVPNLGDENHIWTPRGVAGWPTLAFRKGNVNVTIFAPSAAVAKRFARHVLEQILTE